MPDRLTTGVPPAAWPSLAGGWPEQTRWLRDGHAVLRARILAVDEDLEAHVQGEEAPETISLFGVHPVLLGNLPVEVSMDVFMMTGGGAKVSENSIVRLVEN